MKLERHFEHWPKHLPHTYDVPQTNVYHNLAVSAARYPDKTAIIYYEQRIAYQQLHDEVVRMAGALERLGVARGDRVLLYTQNSPQFIIAFYAILRANAVVVPLNPMNKTGELRYYAQDSGARVAFVGQELYGQVQPLLDERLLDNVIVVAYSDYLPPQPDVAVPEFVAAARLTPTDRGARLWSQLLASNAAPGPLAAFANDLAVMPYTSGTTGEPKGCMHTHRSVQATLTAGAFWSSPTPSGVQLAVLPFFHVTGLQLSVNAPLFCGATIVVMSRWDRRLAAELIQRHRVTGWINISTMLIDFLANPDIDSFDLSSLRAIGGGGAPLPAAVGERLRAMTGLSYTEGYGLSETIAQTHSNPPERAKLQCLGVPVFNTDARIIDPDTLQELEIGQTGEIVVQGPQVFQGYWNKPQATAEAFVMLDGQQFFRTGDLGYCDDEGYFFMVDRLKRMINAAGYKVWPAEVESILYRHPAVLEACVIGVADPLRGETTKAYIVLKERARSRVTGEQIIAWAREQMAAYKVPHLVEFADALPKTATGKILWRQLQEDERARTQEPKS